jgi:hypothetical protein
VSPSSWYPLQSSRWYPLRRRCRTRVSQRPSLVRVCAKHAYFKDWTFDFGLCRAPKHPLLAFKCLYEVCAPAFQASTPGTDAYDTMFTTPQKAWSWVSSKSPNPTRDNGLLMVIKGEHCGKYVGRIHHRYHEDDGSQQVLITLAVIKEVDGAADTLTGEQFELGPDSLCLAVETIEGSENAPLAPSLQRRSA